MIFMHKKLKIEIAKTGLLASWNLLAKTVKIATLSSAPKRVRVSLTPQWSRFLTCSFASNQKIATTILMTITKACESPNARKILAAEVTRWVGKNK